MRDACVDQAFRIIADVGIEKLSLRDVARRLGVSHQAPYKHFANRDHILAEVVARCFDDFRHALEAARAAAPEDPRSALSALGLAYFDYARIHPLEYRLMFGTPLPDKESHPRMMASARHAFALLQEVLTDMPVSDAGAPSAALDALFVWSTIHGLATILQSDALATIGLTDQERAQAIARCMDRIGLALQP